MGIFGKNWRTLQSISVPYNAYGWILIRAFLRKCEELGVAVADEYSISRSSGILTFYYRANKKELDIICDYMYKLEEDRVVICDGAT